MPLLFGYGSLVPGDAGARLATLTGWRRTWGVAMDNSADIPGYKHFEDAETGDRPAVWVAFVDIESGDDGVVTGTVSEIGEDDLPALDARERNYRRERVRTSAGDAWAYVGSPEGRERLRRATREGRCVVARDYLDRVHAGFAALIPDGVARFERETGPRPGPVAALRVIPHSG